jgi:cation diffusion facilitator family transporter
MQSAETGGARKAAREKRWVAMSSLVAAIFLTGMKLVVGVWTGSLGILAEAAHSGLDLVAAAVTFFAVRVSDKPPDDRHQYGHGKVENLSALVETLLLLITCVWIIYEGLNRIFFKPVEIEANVWAFGVVIVSIAIDFSRSRALMRTAKRYQSQALEADALHFSTDIWSSAVVLFGLALVRANDMLGGPPALAKADAVAALGVALIVVYVSIQLGKRSVMVLLDTAPEGLAQEVRDRVQRIEGVTASRQVRIRRAGAALFADIVLEIKGDSSFEKAHEITHSVEQVVRELAPGADVLVHYEPGDLDRDLASRIRHIARELDADAHSIWARRTPEGLHVELHLEVDRDASLDKAHDIASRLETLVKEDVPEISEVVAHLEPMGDMENHGTRLNNGDRAKLQQGITAVVDALSGPGACHHVDIWQEGEVLAASLHCTFSPDVSVQAAHDLSEELEKRLKERYPQLARVVIHFEPSN